MAKNTRYIGDDILVPSSSQVEQVPQAEPVDQSMHLVKEHQDITRRKWLNRVCAGGLSLLVAGAGGLAGRLYQVDQQQQRQLSLLAQKSKQQIEDTQRKAMAQGYHQGYSQGYRQATTDMMKSLEELNGVASYTAQTSANNLMSLHNVFVLPVENSSESITAMLDNARVGRAITSEFGGNTDGLSALIVILEYWQANEGSLPAPLADIDKGKLKSAKIYLDALNGKLEK